MKKITSSLLISLLIYKANASSHRSILRLISLIVTWADRNISGNEIQSFFILALGVSGWMYNAYVYFYLLKELFSFLSTFLAFTFLDAAYRKLEENFAYALWWKQNFPRKHAIYLSFFALM